MLCRVGLFQSIEIGEAKRLEFIKRQINALGL